MSMSSGYRVKGLEYQAVIISGLEAVEISYISIDRSFMKTTDIMCFGEWPGCGYLNSL